MRPTFWRRSYAAKLQEILEVEMTEHIGAEPHQRTASRTGHRNGYKPRTLTTRVGKLNLLVPQRTGRAPSPPSSSPATKEARRPWCSPSWRCTYGGYPPAGWPRLRKSSAAPPLANPPSPRFPLGWTRSSRPGGSAPYLRPPTPTS